MNRSQHVIPVRDLDASDVIVEGKERFTILDIIPVIRRCAGIHVVMRNARTGVKSTGCYSLCGKVAVEAPQSDSEALAETVGIPAAIVDMLGSETVLAVLFGPSLIDDREYGVEDASDLFDTHTGSGS